MVKKKLISTHKRKQPDDGWFALPVPAAFGGGGAGAGAANGVLGYPSTPYRGTHKDTDFACQVRALRFPRIFGGTYFEVLKSDDDSSVFKILRYPHSQTSKEEQRELFVTILASYGRLRENGFNIVDLWCEPDFVLEHRILVMDYIADEVDFSKHKSQALELFKKMIELWSGDSLIIEDFRASNFRVKDDRLVIIDFRENIAPFQKEADKELNYGYIASELIKCLRTWQFSSEQLRELIAHYKQHPNAPKVRAFLLAFDQKLKEEGIMIP